MTRRTKRKQRTKQLAQLSESKKPPLKPQTQKSSPASTSAAPVGAARFRLLIWFSSAEFIRCHLRETVAFAQWTNREGSARCNSQRESYSHEILSTAAASGIR